VRTVLLKNPDIDFQYIRKWLKEFDLFSEKKEFLKTFEEVKKYKFPAASPFETFA
jgi:hypothetical protein